MIHWPVLIKHDGEDQLIAIGSEKEWLSDEELSLFAVTDRDLVIDSLGQVFILADCQQSLSEITALSYTATLDNVLELLNAHLLVTASASQPAAAKTIEQAINSLISSDATTTKQND